MKMYHTYDMNDFNLKFMVISKICFSSWEGETLLRPGIKLPHNDVLYNWVVYGISFTSFRKL